jgi:hypothetical protein
VATQTVEPAIAAPRRARHGSVNPVRAWVRERLTTTPGRLALVSIAVVIGAVCFGAIALIAGQARARAANSAKTDTEPLLAEAANLYASLSDANATATTTFLVGGLEPPARRARYLADVASASNSLASLTRQVGTAAGARNGVATIAAQLPVYTGLIEAARANNRQGLPVGAAYLRQASDLLDKTILPAAGRLYRIEAQRLRDNYDTGTSLAWLLAFIVAMLLSLVLLVLMQRYLAAISHRILNIPTVIATLLLVGLTAWGTSAMISEQNALATAQREGSDSVELLSAARILVSRAQSEESLTLIARGGDTADPADFAAVMAALGQPNGSGGLTGRIGALARRTGTTSAAGEFDQALSAYLARHAQITALESQGQTTAADNLASGLRGSGPSPADRVSASLTGQVAAAQARFKSSAGDATSALSGLSVGIPVAFLLAALLTVVGLRLRINEYR